MMRLLPLLLLLACAVPARAAPNLADLSFQPHPGAALPRDAAFLDDMGHAVKLGALLRDRPGIVTLGYYHCPNLCGVVRDDLFSALQRSGLVAGHDYAVVALSIDPHETANDAAAAKRDDIARYDVPGAAAGWHFLTGDSTAVAHAVGYRSRWDPALQQFMHPVGVVVTTPGGIVSSYLLGVGYTPDALRAALQRAAAAFVAPPPSPVLLLCFHYDASTGRYTLAIERVLRLFALLTVATVGGLLALLHARRPGA